MLVSPSGLLKRGTDRRGIAATELAVLAPFLAMVFCFVVDFARIFYFLSTMEVCAANGAMWASDSFAQGESQFANVTDATRADFPTALQNNLAVSSATSGNTVSVTCTYSFVSITSFPIPGVQGPFTITRTARARIVPVQ